MFQKVWGIGKILCIIGRITCFRRIFLSHSAEKVRGHPFNVSENLGYRKNFMHNRGYHKIPSKNFCLTVLKNFVGIPSMFQKVWGIEKILCIIEGITIFRRKLFFSQCQKIRGRPFNVSENLGYRKILCIRGGITSFRRKLFVSQCWKISWATLQCFRKFGVLEKFMHNRGYHNFLTKKFGLVVPKIFVGIPSMIQKVWGIGKFLCIIGGITCFRRKFFVSQCWKISWASLQCFRKIGGIGNFYA